jgi:hypothetical protein
VDTENDIEEESDTEMETTSKKPWQILKKRKRSKLSPDMPQESTPFQIETQNRYFLKIAEITHFFCTRNRLYQRFVQPLLAFKHSRDVTALCDALC